MEIDWGVVTVIALAIAIVWMTRDVWMNLWPRKPKPIASLDELWKRENEMQNSPEFKEMVRNSMPRIEMYKEKMPCEEIEVECTIKISDPHPENEIHWIIKRTFTDEWFKSRYCDKPTKNNYDSVWIHGAARDKLTAFTEANKKPRERLWSDHDGNEMTEQRLGKLVYVAVRKSRVVEREFIFEREVKSDLERS